MRLRRHSKQCLELPVDETGVHIPGSETGMPAEAGQKTCIRHTTGHPAFLQCRQKTGQRRLTCRSMNDDLGDHRIVEGADFVSLANAAVDARRILRQMQMRQGTDRGQEALVSVLGIETRLEGPPIDGELLLFLGERFARGNTQLPFDKVLARDQFRHRMLNLKAGVHFHEIEPVGAQTFGHIGNELDGARTGIVDRFCGGYSGLTHCPAHILRHAGGGGLLDDLLVPALEGAVTLKQMHCIAVAVAKDLYLDMAWLGQVLFDQDTRVAETCFSFAARSFEGCLEIFRCIHAAHALAATTGTGLDQNRVADLVCLGLQECGILIVAVVARNDRDAGLLHQRLGCVFQAHGAYGVCTWADESDSSLLQCVDKVRIFGEETVSGMNCLGTTSAADIN